MEVGTRLPWGWALPIGLALVVALAAAPAAASQGERPARTLVRAGHVDLRIYTPAGVVVTDTDTVVDPDEVDAEDANGGYLFTNIDDDDNGTVFDLGQTDVAGEDDLVKIELRASCNDDGGPCEPTGQVKLSAVAGADKIRVWNEATKTTEVTLPATYDGASGSELKLLATLYVEGIAPSGAARDVQLKLESVDFFSAPDTVKATVLRVAKVGFKGKDGNLDAGLLGLRVFPDSLTSGGAARDKVKVTAKLNVAPPLEAVDIFLKSFDVDDPWAAGNVVDPNDDVGDGAAGDYRDADGSSEYGDSVANGTYLADTAIPYGLHEDNRGSVTDPAGNVRKAGAIDGDSGDPDLVATLTFPVGTLQASKDFQVTMQPGDNFRVVASHDKDFLPQLRNRDWSDGIKIYDDSVGAVIPDHAKRVSPLLTVWRILHLEVDAMAAPGAAEVFDGAGAGNDDVGPGQAGSATIFDADSSLQKPDTALLAGTFAAAYLQVQDDLEALGWDVVDDIPFVHNVADADADDRGEDARDDPLISNPRFWIVHILGAYEGEPAEDNDPNAEAVTFGYTPNTAGNEHRGFSLVYQEAIRDGHDEHAPAGVTTGQAEQRTVLHEVAHQFELREGSGQVMTGNFGAANPSYPLDGLTFTAAQLSAIRAIDAP